MTENPLRKEYWLGTVDPRPLALFRVLFGTVVLVDFLHRIPYVRAFLSDEGVFPRDSMPGLAGSWSIFRIAGAPAAVMVLYLAGCAAVAAVVLGYRTRIAQAAMFVFVASMAARNPTYGSGPDHLIGVMSFWLLFADSGAVWSVDWLWNGRRNRVVPALGLRLLQWQLGLALLFASMAKWSPWRNGLAIYHITQFHDWVTPLGATLGAWPALCAVLTWMVMGLEVVIPLLLIPLAPLAPRWCRAAGMLAAASLFTGIFFFVWVGSYPELLLASLALFVLPEWLDGLGLGSRLTEVSEPISGSGLALVALGAAQLAVVVWSLIAARSELPEGAAVQQELEQVDLAQKWLMFVRPVPFSFRWTDTGLFADGSRREVLADAVPQITVQPPPEAHWRETRQQIVMSEPIRQSIVSYACAEINRVSPVPLVELTLDLHGTAVHDPGEPSSEERLLHSFRIPCQAARP